MKNEYLTLSDLFGIFKTRILLILLATVLCGALAFGATLLMPKEYTCTSTYYVKNLLSSDYVAKYGVSSSQYTATQNMAADYAEVIPRSDTLLDRALERHELPVSSRAQLRSMIQTSADSKSATFSVSITADDPTVASAVIAALEAELPQVITEIAWGDVDEDFTCVALLMGAGAAKQTAPRYKLLTALGAAAGFVLSYLVFLLIFIFDNRITAETDVTRVLGDYPILGRVPHWAGKKMGGEQK